MIDGKYASFKVAELTVLPFFPANQEARILILDMLKDMVRNAGRAPGDTPEQVQEKDQAALDWLIRRAITLWSKWEGLRELRAIYCSRYRPGDGIETTSSLYLDGVPYDPSLPRLALPAPQELQAWPKEELERIGKAWAERNRLTPAEQRRQRLNAWLDDESCGHTRDVTVLDHPFDDALIGIGVLASHRKTKYAVYDYDALLECLENREGLNPELALEAAEDLAADVLLFFRPPGEAMRPKVSPSITQEEIDRALAVARARREGWTPERLAEIQAEVQRREEQGNG